MEAKRPRLSSEADLEISYSMDESENLIRDFIEKSINEKIKELNVFCRKSLAAKDSDVHNSKLAFSTVAKENRKLSKDIVDFSKDKEYALAQLNEGFKLIQHKDELINKMGKDILENQEIIEVQKMQIEKNKTEIEELRSNITECEEEYKSLLRKSSEESDDYKAEL